MAKSTNKETTSANIRSPRWVRGVLIALLTIHAGLLAWAATRHSPTSNEVCHLPAGISHWQFGRFELYRVNPPLVRMVAALPVLAVGAEPDWSAFYESPGARPVFSIGSDFVQANGYRSFWLYTLARWACIPFSLIGGYVCFRWSRELYGDASGLLAVTLWCFSPNILAHAELITPDAGATALGVSAFYLFWRWLKNPTWAEATVAGIVLGLVELTKLTWIILFGVWPATWIAWWIFSRRDTSRVSLRRQASQMIVILLLALHVLNTGYAYDGTLSRLDSFQFVSRILGGDEEILENPQRQNRFDGTWLGSVPVPLPRQYVLGADVQKRDFERERRSYLRGEWATHGWWYYYIYALAIKVPLGTWCLVVLCGTVTVARRGYAARFRDEFVILLPLTAVLVLVSSETNYNAHLRYVLPIFPFAFIWISKLGKVATRAGKTTIALVTVALLWSVGSSLWFYPHTLAYFNESVGGPKNGHAHLTYSNIDWGQDLLYLKRWLDDHPDVNLTGLAYFGTFNPRIAGIEFENPAEAPTSVDALAPKENNRQTPLKWYAISVNALTGMDHGIQRVGEFSRGASYRMLRDAKPKATAGYSILIYHATLPEGDSIDTW